VWIPVMYLTKPEADETLDAFYRRVRPGGCGWGSVRARTGLEPVTLLRIDLARTVAAAAALFGGMFAIGGAMLVEPGLALGSTLVLAAGMVGLRVLGKRNLAARAATSEL
jgi:SSS family solute:Na+ symporter